MPGSESDAFVSDNEKEVKPVQRFDNYAPPSERRKTRVSSVKRTPHKRALIDDDDEFNGSPVRCKRATPVKKAETKT